MSRLIGRQSRLLSGFIAAPYVFTNGSFHPAAFDNVLTGLIGDLYAGLDVVSRELVGFIPSVSRNNGVERAAVGQTVVWPVTAAATVVDITPAMTVPNPADQTLAAPTMTITKARAAEFGWVGEQQRALNVAGPGVTTVQADFFAQGLRALVNEIETDLAVEAAAKASRAYGTAGTTPFASTLGDTAQVRKMLDDNGAPATDRSLIIDTTAGAAVRTLSQLTKVNEAGTADLLRQGVLFDIHGFAIRESAAIGAHVKGTGASATTNAAGYAIGATTITLASAGTGTFVAGDVITFAGDTNKYVVVTGDADVSGGGTIVIAAPGLRVAIAASATAITIGNAYRRNVGFVRSAMHLAVRPPALPAEGDLARDRMVITDPRSGLSFEVSVYPGYRKVRFEVAAAWGVKASKSEHIVILLG